MKYEIYLSPQTPTTSFSLSGTHFHFSSPGRWHHASTADRRVGRIKKAQHGEGEVRQEAESCLVKSAFGWMKVGAGFIIKGCHMDEELESLHTGFVSSALIVCFWRGHGSSSQNINSWSVNPETLKKKKKKSSGSYWLIQWRSVAFSFDQKKVGKHGSFFQTAWNSDKMLEQ